MNRFVATWIFGFGLLVTLPGAAETVGTFTLDALSFVSFVSFGDEEVVALPAGSTIRFRFGDEAGDGSRPFTIRPGDVSIDEVDVSSGGVLRYALASGATGTMRPTPSGRQIEFTAKVRATLNAGGSNDGSYHYTIPFTTEATAASNVADTRTLSVYGLRLVEGAWYGQIVGATTNKANAFPEPGSAVYTVLSGSFDQVP